MDTAEGRSLRSRHGYAHSRIEQCLALPNLRIRALSPRQRNEEERQPVRNAILCLQPMQRHVPEPDSVQCIQHCSAQHRVFADRYAASSPQMSNARDSLTAATTALHLRGRTTAERLRCVTRSPPPITTARSARASVTTKPLIAPARRRCDVLFAMLRDGTYYHPVTPKVALTGS